MADGHPASLLPSNKKIVNTSDIKKLKWLHLAEFLFIIICIIGLAMDNKMIQYVFKSLTLAVILVAAFILRDF